MLQMFLTVRPRTNGFRQGSLLLTLLVAVAAGASSHQVMAQGSFETSNASLEYDLYAEAYSSDEGTVTDGDSDTGISTSGSASVQAESGGTDSYAGAGTNLSWVMWQDPGSTSAVGLEGSCISLHVPYLTTPPFDGAHDNMIRGLSRLESITSCSLGFSIEATFHADQPNGTALAMADISLAFTESRAWGGIWEPEFSSAGGGYATITVSNGFSAYWDGTQMICLDENQEPTGPGTTLHDGDTVSIYVNAGWGHFLNKYYYTDVWATQNYWQDLTAVLRIVSQN